ncbi:MAG: Rrf2 family transcriptional regulator [Actinobacteria bacterium]|nr:Rrf2 family transcriptional regulator [Actinomycetota bacterium]
MNMTLSKRGDYVVRSALCLARAHGSGHYRKIREVVAEMDVPQTFASQILADLVRAGLAESKAGKGGGYRLARPPETVSLLEVVEAGEGPLRSERCALGEGPCRWDVVCPLHETWREATAALRDSLDRTSLAVLVERDEALSAGTYPMPTDSHRHVQTGLELSDRVQVELSQAELSNRLQSASSLLARCVAAGYDEAESLRKRIEPSGISWACSSMPAVAYDACPADGSCAVASPIAGTIGGAATAAIDMTASGSRYRLSWEAGGHTGVASRFEGEIAIRELDPERTELQLAGRFRPPGLIDEDELATRLSQTTIRATLRRLAHELETQAGLLTLASTERG